MTTTTSEFIPIPEKTSKPTCPTVYHPFFEEEELSSSDSSEISDAAFSNLLDAFDRVAAKHASKNCTLSLFPETQVDENMDVDDADDTEVDTNDIQVITLDKLPDDLPEWYEIKREYYARGDMIVLEHWYNEYVFRGQPMDKEMEDFFEQRFEDPSIPPNARYMNWKVLYDYINLVWPYAIELNDPDCPIWLQFIIDLAPHQFRTNASCVLAFHHWIDLGTVGDTRRAENERYYTPSNFTKNWEVKIEKEIHLDGRVNRVEAIMPVRYFHVFQTAKGRQLTMKEEIVNSIGMQVRSVNLKYSKLAELEEFRKKSEEEETRSMFDMTDADVELLDGSCNDEAQIFDFEF